MIPSGSEDFNLELSPAVVRGSARKQTPPPGKERSFRTRAQMLTFPRGDVCGAAGSSRCWTRRSKRLHPLAFFFLKPADVLGPTGAPG